MTSPSPSDNRGTVRRALRQPWALALAAAIVVGALVRLYGLPGQVLLDDEWHSLNYVIDRPFYGVFLEHSLAANCIPQNIYNWVLLRTAGWSEMLLRLPSVVCGLAGLVVFPLMVSRLYTRFIALVFAWLLALSPCTTFYARLCRPYSMVMFFGFLSLLFMLRWLRTGRTRDALWYAAAGFLAIYYHLYATIPVLMPLVCLAGFMTGRRFFPAAFRNWRLPPFSQYFPAAAIIIGLGLILLLPPNLANSLWTNTRGNDRVTFQTALNFMRLVTGANHLAIVALFAVTAIAGVIFLLRKEPVAGTILSSIFLVFYTNIALSHQSAMHAALQVARYGIVLFPLLYLLAATGLHRVFETGRLRTVSKRWRNVAAMLFVAGLLAGSPLWKTYAMPNNFTNHSGFQDSYTPLDWSKSRVRDLTPLPQMEKKDIPEVYFKWSGDAEIKGIIEYPMFVGDPLNLYYYYQMFHKKKTVAGYIPEVRFTPLQSNNQMVYQDTPIDYVLSRACERWGGRVRFTNMVPLTDARLLRKRYDGWIIVVHRQLFREMFPSNVPPGKEDHQLSTIAANILLKEFGNPLYADGQLWAWRIDTPSPAH